MKRQRQSIDFNMKKQIIEASSEGMKQREMAQKFNVERSTISKILKNRERILSALEEGGGARRTKIQKPPDLDQPLLAWLRVQRSKGIPINGPMLQKKALEIAKILQIENFNASPGWLSNFKERHSISFARPGKSETSADWRQNEVQQPFGKRQRLQEKEGAQDGDENGEEGEPLMQPSFSLSNFLNTNGELVETQNQGQILDMDHQRYEGEEGNCSSFKDEQQDHTYLHANGGQLLAFEDAEFGDGDDNSSPLDSKLKEAKVAYFEAQTELAIAQANEARARESETRTREQLAVTQIETEKLRARLLQLEYQEKIRNLGSEEAVNQ